ncbi:TonB-dependent receptor [Ottowia testudinis]|uniref:TonB-dependent receptor n=1 Tax=Ottowia testudinis TaxID=2816950 RepID=A0A975CIU0_9BURK|nr:TonB-dependent receptor [Ottowia testudinis]QTD47120.1 TonB-dependent receptor [Ottowia testudinis]
MATLTLPINGGIPTHWRRGPAVLLGASALLLAGSAAAQQPAAEEPAPASLPAVTVTGEAPAPNASLNQYRPDATGSRFGLTPRETPASVSTLSREQIISRGLTRTQDAVVSLPGLAESPAPGNGFSALSARGFVGHNSVAQLVDGTRLAVASGTVTYPFSTWPIESVQVLRGPGSVLYGDSAVGAVVNYLTKKPLFDRSEREAFLSVGQHGKVQGGIGLRGPISDTVAYAAYLDAARSSGVRSDSAYQRQNVSLALSLRPNARFAATAMFDGGHNDDSTYFGTPLRGGTVPADWRGRSFNFSDARVRYNDQAWRLSLRYDAADGVQLRNETYHLRSDRRWRNAESYRFDAASGWVSRADFIAIGHELKQTGNRFEVQVDRPVAGVPHQLVLGLDAFRTELAHLNNSPYGGSDSVNPDAIVPGLFHTTDAYGLGRSSRLDTVALFAESHWRLSPRWSVLGGLRADRMRLRSQNMRATAGPDQVKYSPVTGRIGTVFKASGDLSLYGQFATGTDPLSGAMSLPGGTTTHDLTRARQWEVGVKGDVPALRGEWSVALYRITKRNLLSRDVDNPAITQQIGQQSSTGVELAFGAEPVRGWTVDANLALVRARYGQLAAVSGGQAISYAGNVPTGAPERLFNLWSTWQPHPQWQVGAGLRHVGRRPLNPANSAYLPSYTVLNAALTFKPTRQSSLVLAVQNLGNRVYPLSGGLSQWLLGAPRTVSLTGRLTF